MSINYHTIITIEPGKRSGKPCIRGLRITVDDILDCFGGHDRTRSFKALRLFDPR